MKNLVMRDKHFYIGDEKITILAGAIHYFRVVPEYWEDRLRKLKRVFDTWIAKKSLKVPLGAYFFVKFANFVLRNVA